MTEPSYKGKRSHLIHGGIPRSTHMETSEAVYLTSGYVYANAEEAERAFAEERLRYVYSRYRNPTVETLEQRLAHYEGAACAHATASGMAAVFSSLMAQLQCGDRVVAPYALFGSCLFIVQTLLPQYGIETVLIDGTDYAQWRAALSRPTRAVLLETPTNPCLDLIDIAAVADLAHAAGARLIVDNVFATPVHQRPLSLGADIVVYSATKHIDGQGRCLGGVVLCDHAFSEILQPFLKHTGPALSPFNAWTMLKGLETLELRVHAATAGALDVARFLNSHERIAQVRYPGLPNHPQHALAQTQMTGGSTLIAFDLLGTKADAFRFMNALRLILISNNLGDAKSLITHPATTTHRRLSDTERARVGLSSTTLRLSVGLEEPADLIADLATALSV